MSLSEYEISLLFEDLRVKATLSRKFSPIIVERLVRILPLEGRVIRYGKSLLCIMIAKPLGIEKPRSEVKKGELFYWPRSNCLGIALGDGRLGFKVAILGKVAEGYVDELRKVKGGEKVRVELISG